jgi:hypothetical protein
MLNLGPPSPAPLAIFANRLMFDALPSLSLGFLVRPRSSVFGDTRCISYCDSQGDHHRVCIIYFLSARWKRS